MITFNQFAVSLALLVGLFLVTWSLKFTPGPDTFDRESEQVAIDMDETSATGSNEPAKNQPAASPITSLAHVNHLNPAAGSSIEHLEQQGIAILDPRTAKKSRHAALADSPSDPEMALPQPETHRQLPEPPPYLFEAEEPPVASSGEPPSDADNVIVKNRSADDSGREPLVGAQFGEHAKSVLDPLPQPAEPPSNQHVVRRPIVQPPLAEAPRTDTNAPPLPMELRDVHGDEVNDQQRGSGGRGLVFVERPIIAPVQTVGFIVHTVTPGDNLPALAQQYLGDPARYMEIVRLNAGVLTSPPNLPIGIQIKVPVPAK